MIVGVFAPLVAGEELHIRIFKEKSEPHLDLLSIPLLSRGKKLKTFNRCGIIGCEYKTCIIIHFRHFTRICLP